MPANPKYLSKPWHRANKIVLGVLGGYIFSVCVHMALAKVVPNRDPIILLSIWTTWVVWIAAMITVFAIKRTWLLWIVFVVVMTVCGVIFYLK